MNATRCHALRAGLVGLLASLQLHAPVTAQSTTATLSSSGAAIWTLATPDVRIGSLDDVERSLTTVPHLFVDDDRLFVAQPQQGQVRMYDAETGELRRRIGRSGEGPGEFLNPNWIGSLGDTIWVNDGNQSRLTFFDRDGEYLADRRHPEAPRAVGGIPATFGMLTEEGGYLYTVPFSRDPGTPLPIFSVDPAGEVHEIGIRTGLPSRSIAVADGGFHITTRRFWTMTTWSPDPQGTSVALAERKAPDDADEAFYRITRVSMEGDTLFSTRVEYEPIRVPGVVRDSLPDDTPDEYRPRYYPPVSGVVAGRDGATWVAREETPEPTRQWDVFDEAGRRIATLEAPARLEIVDATRERIWGVLPDELDVPYVVRMPVRRDR